MGLVKGLLKGIKIAGKAKAAIDALDDDTDLDGVKEVDELKAKVPAIKAKAEALLVQCKEALAAGQELAGEIKDAGLIALGLINHVAKEASK